MSSRRHLIDFTATLAPRGSSSNHQHQCSMMQPRPSPRQWGPEELLCLQQASQVIGIRLSEIFRFAETVHNDSTPAGECSPSTVSTPDSVLQSSISGSAASAGSTLGDWAVNDLLTLQLAAKTIRVDFSRLLAFAEATIAPPSTPPQTRAEPPAPDLAESLAPARPTSNQPPGNAFVPALGNLGGEAPDLTRAAGIPFDTPLQHDYSSTFEDYALNNTICNGDTLHLPNPFVPYPSWELGDSSFDQPLTLTACERNPDAPGEECLRCQNRKYSFSKLPCLYFQITEITLFRTITDPIAKKPYKELAMRTELDVFGIYSLPSHCVGRTAFFELTQNLGSVLRLSATCFDVTTVSEFQFKLMKGLHTHPFRLTDVSVAREQIRAFIVNSMAPYVDNKLKMSSDDGFSQSIFMAARQRAAHDDKQEHHKFLANVLYLWTACRTIEGGWEFCGPESLDLAPRDGCIRLVDAPFIDYQFSAIMVQDILIPLRWQVLKQMKVLIHENKPHNWFAIFLASFILLHTYALLVKQQGAFARSRKATVKYTMMSLIKEIHMGAQALLTHFHHICKGQKPFEIDWDQDADSKLTQRMAKLSNDEVELMKRIAPVVKERASYFDQLMKTDNYESEHWFTGQLFVPTWTPPKTIEESPVV
ncbi:hypothetical protein B0T10DRAFT_555592 [Thelonectria olida]|uniref:Uncharacterized protein n=1 Tax=Thelonectria olida TaxID=1576542 RepID=A0A9P8WF37_9HYPO|nr:hypothetical protein B0T10DRAFT_555592 [Thelonectria olida]